MSAKWIGTKFKGVRYYEHPTRKHGVVRDKYLSIRYQRNGKRTEEGIGWTSELDPKDNKKWTPEKAALLLAELKEAAKGLKQGPCHLAERRDIDDQRKEEEHAEQAIKDLGKITFTLYFNNTYYTTAKTQKKESSYEKEEEHFRLWLEPELGKKNLKSITHLDIQRIKKKMLDANKSPRYIQYVMATARQVWNSARRDGLVIGDSPTRSVKVPKFDNRRQRFLNPKEADLLLKKLKEKNEQVYHMALLSLYTGMRASEVFDLTWGCIDTERGLIAILDAKPGKGRTAFMTEQVKTIFLDMKRGKYDDLVFPHSKGGAYSEIPTLFRDAVAELKFNEDVSDPRQRVCFHSLRHSFGSWHAEAGTDLYVVKELLGHGSITLTERYSHLTKGTLQNATKNIEQTITRAEEKEPGQVVNFEK